MKPTDKSHIETLLSRFLDGTSTLDEERTLARYFRTEDVPGEWEAYKDMFAWFDQGMPEPTAAPAPARLHLLRRWAAVAAVVAVVGGIGAYLLRPVPQPERVALQEPAVAAAEVSQPVALPAVEPKPLPVRRQPVAASRPEPAAPVVEQPAEPAPYADDLAELKAELESLARDEALQRRAVIEADIEARGFRVVGMSDGYIDVQPIEEQSNFICL